MNTHTEEEAKQLRCCGPDGCGTTATHHGIRHCIGSACMAWVWEKNIVRHSGFDDEQPPTHGRCGLVKGE